MRVLSVSLLSVAIARAQTPPDGKVLQEWLLGRTDPVDERPRRLCTEAGLR